MANELNTETLTIRIPASLRDALEKRAEQERRSMASCARVILEAALMPKRRRRR